MKITIAALPASQGSLSMGRKAINILRLSIKVFLMGKKTTLNTLMSANNNTDRM